MNTQSLHRDEIATEEDAAAARSQLYVVREALKGGESLIPLLPSTVLGWELLHHNQSFDLSAASELVLGDIGAILRLFRLVAEEFPSPSERPTRVVDCLASLSLRTVAEAFSAEPADAGGIAPLFSITRHSRLIAHHARLMAEALGQSTEEAYLIGMLHEANLLRDLCAGSRPAEVYSDTHTDKITCGCFAGLPGFIAQAIEDWNEHRSGSVWTTILDAAHASVGEDLDSGRTRVRP